MLIKVSTNQDILERDQEESDDENAHLPNLKSFGQSNIDLEEQREQTHEDTQTQESLEDSIEEDQSAMQARILLEDEGFI